MDSQQVIKAALPEHLRQFVAHQDYERYTPRDQAVWRYVMRRLVGQLRQRAHPVYFDGLAKTGITIEQIPSIDEMNIRLDKLGWRAVVVDGFIPPQAFMELQALKVLPVALAMRSVDHLDYTPAPDIIHESAGHAPIIADEEYSEYLQRFGELGMRAIYNQWDVTLYEAVRHLSIVKETLTKKNSERTEADVHAAELKITELLQSQGEPSELALLTRLHWWTVEYGLVGNVDDCRIFGAGLLSSLRESLTCLDKSVKKIPLTIDAIQTSYDITRPQPQLFVTKSCRHLTQVLEEYAAVMCYRRGGLESIQVVIDAGVVATCVYSSGLQVSGLFKSFLRNAIGSEIYIGTEGPTQLAVKDKQLDGHGIDYHAAGFGSPVGRICNLMKPLEEASEYELQELGIKRDSKICIDFVSGVRVEGWLRSIVKKRRRIVLLSFTDCRVTGPNGECLFQPDWGVYDMAVGETICSVYSGSADRLRFNVYPSKPDSKTSNPVYTGADQLEFDLYQRVRTLRETQSGSDLAELVDLAGRVCPDAWLLHQELSELAEGNETLLRKIQSRLSHAPGSN